MTPVKVLVVDDSLTMRNLISAALRFAKGPCRIVLPGPLIVIVPAMIGSLPRVIVAPEAPPMKRASFTGELDHVTFAPLLFQRLEPRSQVPLPWVTGGPSSTVSQVRVAAMLGTAGGSSAPVAMPRGRRWVSRRMADGFACRCYGVFPGAGVA